MTFKERMLEIVKAHPEGISTIQIAVVMGGSYETDAKTLSLRSNICQGGRVLEKYGLIYRRKLPRNPWEKQLVTWWFPVQDSN